MSWQTFLAGLAINARRVRKKYDKYNEIGDENSTIDLIKETSQFLGTAAAGSLFELMFIGKVIQKTGLDRVFDSFYNKLPLDVIPETSMMEYLKNQKALRKVAGVGFNIGLNEGIDAINEWSPGTRLYDFIHDDLANFFASAQNWTPQRADPLTLDLDGDGIETTAQTGWDGVLFDHNNNGQKTGTGWLSADDGFLVLDKNNNGTIDNGNELFGDNTQLSNGAAAATGFAALADLDSNQDGQVDSQDSAYADLRVWQDLNQDGISQANELKTLAELNIASLSTMAIEADIEQNDNIITHTASYTKTDGSTGQTSNLDFSASTFHTEYTDTSPLNDIDSARPDMHGAGSVHNLRHAAAQSGVLANVLDRYSQASTRDQQQAQLDQLVSQWSQIAKGSDSIDI